MVVIAFVLGILAGLAAGPAAADAIDDARAALAAHEEGDHAAAIRLYTDAIDSGELETGHLAVAFYNRGNAHLAERAYDAAIADYEAAASLRPDYAAAHNNRGIAEAALGRYEAAVAAYDAAIRVRPDYALAYKNRGNAHAVAGSYERAIADYDAALARDPGLAAAYNNRGNANFFLGRYAAAVGDYRAALDLEPADTYSALWLYLAQRRDGHDGAAALRAHAARVGTDAWPGVVVRFYLGDADMAAVLAAISGADAERRRERACEAYFYVGAHALAAGNDATAARAFRRALDTGLAHFIEYMGAKAELARLEAQ